MVTYWLFCVQTMALTSAYFSAHAEGAIGLCSVSNSSRFLFPRRFFPLFASESCYSERRHYPLVGRLTWCLVFVWYKLWWIDWLSFTGCDWSMIGCGRLWLVGLYVIDSRTCMPTQWHVNSWATCVYWHCTATLCPHRALHRPSVTTTFTTPAENSG